MRIIFYILFVFVLVFVLTVVLFFFLQKENKQPVPPPATASKWVIKSIDTMKYSRDLARSMLNDEAFDAVIDNQMSEIAGAGANYVGIGTPYDDEFHPMLVRWVKAARKYNLRVWFRGNFSGWEGWFDYPKMDKSTHVIKTEQFILSNRDLFRDGDIFTSCPECENGGDSNWGDAESLDSNRAFLIVEYKTAKNAFAQTGKKVETGYYSMNGDLAASLMDRRTTRELGGIVVVDHYVDAPEKLALYIRQIAKQSGGKVVLGEFGAPIPDIHGNMTEEEQDKWIKKAMTEISGIPELIGVNYWVNLGGSTALWNDDGTARQVVKTINDFYSRK